MKIILLNRCVRKSKMHWNLMGSHRAANGLSALPLDAKLSAIARKQIRGHAGQGIFFPHLPHLRLCKRHAQHLWLQLQRCR